jgi:hypothetical protein
VEEQKKDVSPGSPFNLTSPSASAPVRPLRKRRNLEDHESAPNSGKAIDQRFQAVKLLTATTGRFYLVVEEDGGSNRVLTNWS